MSMCWESICLFHFQLFSYPGVEVARPSNDSELNMLYVYINLHKRLNLVVAADECVDHSVYWHMNISWACVSKKAAYAEKQIIFHNPEKFNRVTK